MDLYNYKIGSDNVVFIPEINRGAILWIGL